MRDYRPCLELLRTRQESVVGGRRGERIGPAALSGVRDEDHRLRAGMETGEGHPSVRQGKERDPWTCKFTPSVSL